MDIEGAEMGAINAARATLEKGAHFAIAAYHLVNGEPTATPLHQLFKERGYQINLRFPEHLTLFASPKLTA